MTVPLSCLVMLVGMFVLFYVRFEEKKEKKNELHIFEKATLYIRQLVRVEYTRCRAKSDFAASWFFYLSYITIDTFFPIFNRRNTRGRRVWHMHDGSFTFVRSEVF